MFVQEEATVTRTFAMEDAALQCGCPACKLASLIAAADGDERYKKAPQEPAWGSLDQESYGELADVLEDLRAHHDGAVVT